ncbi:PEP-CTERM sorting domain-containing protein [Sphingosinicella microcystinivorans]|uniref:Npun_F0296 family exosortase-dependent surface protein n=1 Tax=Sphingosinicella microcystinivorans TaxID=335406 RepID=UPI0022F3F3FC|nr:PEP-CTERM sorting domain-containing protein [Sphingosinicella microcystinivorans]WBX83184.1 PEP-CTERM sorting domain-containing protein [Sphingosinicella microcystinivorans]
MKTSNADFDYFHVETFDNKAPVTNSIYVSSGTYDNGTSGDTSDDVSFSLTYTGVNIIPTDVYGGADLTDYAVAGINLGDSYEVKISTSAGAGVNYFGYWLSALDAGNTVTFYLDDDFLQSFSAGDVASIIGSNPAYAGHPDYPAGANNSREPYAFLNFYAKDGQTFNRIVFSQAPATGGGQAGYESDNHTIGFYTRKGDDETPVTTVPEPAALALFGLGLVGLGLSRRRKRA